MSDNTSTHGSSSHFLQVCLRVPNLGSLVFFLVFVLGVPAVLLSAGALTTLQFYLPLLVMMSAALVESGRPYYFQNLYPLETPTNLSGFLSKMFINGLAAVGILSAAVLTTVNSGGNVALGMAVGMIALAVAFPIGTQVIPFFIKQVDALLRDVTRKGTRFPGNWHKYFTGAAFVIFFISMQFVATRYARDTLTSSTSKTSSNYVNA